MTVRVRFAPSPTGGLHPGNARSALFNWLFARHHGGTFVLRIEDTDRSRLVEASQHDQVLLTSDGFPTYHLAATVDDHLMEISHVIRGDEWLGSFPKHLILYRMLGWDPPEFAHLPQVLGPDRAKLSKRHGAEPVLAFRDKGYLPEAMDNFLAFLGWSPGTGEEIFDLEGLMRAFELEKVQVSPAIFDLDKLGSVNGQHIRRLSPPDFAYRIEPFTPGLTPSLRLEAAPLIQERVRLLTDATELLDFLVAPPARLPTDLLRGRHDPSDAAAALVEVRAVFAAGEIGPELEPELRAIAERLGWSAGDLFMALRVALTGRKVTPPLLPSAGLLGRAECLRRLDAAVAQLSGSGPDA